jgi:hypothetical protein
MTYELTNEEKISIIDQHLKNLEYSKYNLKISLLEMGSGNVTNPENIKNTEMQIDSINEKQKVLNKEINILNGENNG